MSETLSVRFDNDEYEGLQAMSLLTGRSMAALVVSAIRANIGHADVDLLLDRRVAEVQDAAETLRQYAEPGAPLSGD